MSTQSKNAETWVYNPHSGCILTEKFTGQLFDSFFAKNLHYTQNHHLIFLLRINLRQVNNKTTALDSKKRSFPVKNWTSDEWQNFTAQFERQSHLWNNRFWLIPPNYFSLLDVKNGGNKIRPNIKCLLRTEITNNSSSAHRTIDVVNLDVDAIRRQRNINPGSGTFKSNARNLDSLDIKPRDVRYEDDKGVERTIKNYYTIAHELGHAIGLKHIGVLKSRPQCTFAIALKNLGIKNVSSHLQRGSNAEVCYGEFDSLGLAENIMGLGTKFEEINAQPWVERIAMHTNTIARDWKVSLSHVSPKNIF